MNKRTSRCKVKTTMATAPTRVSRSLLLVGVPTFIIAIAGYMHVTGGRYVTTDNAYVKAHVVRISPEIDGEVAKVLVRDNDVVEKGAVLFRLVDDGLKLDLTVADAEVETVRQRLLSLKARYGQEQAELARANERIRFLEVQYARQKRLKKKGIGGGSKFDEAEHNVHTAKQDAAAIRQRNEMTLMELGGGLDRPVEQHALYRKALATRDRVALDLERTTVSAPAGGVLSSIKLQPGERVAAGKPVFALVGAEEFWIEANLKEVHLTNVRVGQDATVVIDAYPNVEWRGVVDSISPATGSEFSLLPPQNATGNWVKVVQRVPVRLKLTIPDNAPALRVGMTASVSIDTGVERTANAVAEMMPGVVAPSSR